MSNYLRFKCMKNVLLITIHNGAVVQLNFITAKPRVRDPSTPQHFCAFILKVWFKLDGDKIEQIVHTSVLWLLDDVKLTSYIIWDNVNDTNNNNYGNYRWLLPKNKQVRNYRRKAPPIHFFCIFKVIFYTIDAFKTSHSTANINNITYFIEICKNKYRFPFENRKLIPLTRKINRGWISIFFQNVHFIIT